MRVQDALNIKNMSRAVYICVAVAVLLGFYILHVYRQTQCAIRAAQFAQQKSSGEAYADPTRAQRRGRVSDTERTKLYNSGGRKGYI